MPSLLSKYRNKKRESSVDESSSNHRKGASDSSHDSSVKSPSTASSARGLNSPFMGEEKRTSPPKGQKPKAQQQLHELHQELPNVSSRSPRTNTAPVNANLHQNSGQPPRQPPQGVSHGNTQSYQQGHLQGYQQGNAQGTPSQTAQGYPPQTSQNYTQSSAGQHARSHEISPQQKRQAEQPSTPSHAIPVKGDRIERFSPQQERQDPWAEWQIRRACPSARFGHAANNVAARDGELLIMGGIRDMDILDDLWIIDTNSLSGYQVKTEGPYVGPRVGHAALTLGNAYIMMGGDTKIKESDPLDDNLYLLNTSTFKWTVAEPVGPRPCGRYGHSICNLGVRIYVFGGQVDDLFFDDMWMFDLNNLRPPSARWEKIEPVTQPPPPRTNHTVVTYEDKIYLFGGANGDLWYSDTWCFDSKTNAWTQLDCTGYVPAPCQGHAATIVGDVMYVFGGMSSQGLLIGQLFALKITTRKWYTFQNLGAGPSPRSGHSLTAFDGDKILVWGGTDQSNAAFVLDVSRISYPPDDEAVVGTSYDSREVQSEDKSSVQSQVQNEYANSANSPQQQQSPHPQGAVVADSTNRQVDTHERSTPAARSSVIYSRTSWSPQRRSRLSQYESAESLHRPEDPADIPQDVEEAENESSYFHTHSSDFDRSEDFNKSLEDNRIARDRPDLGPSVLAQSADHSLDMPGSKNLPEGLPNKIPDTPRLREASSGSAEPPKNSASPGGIAGAVAGAAGAIGAIGAGIFGKKSSAGYQNDSLRTVTDGMPGSWTQSRIESDSDDSSEPQIPGINTDDKSIASVNSTGSANHASQHTLDRLNEYDSSYEDALRQANYNNNAADGRDSRGIQDSYMDPDLRAPATAYHDSSGAPGRTTSPDQESRNGSKSDIASKAPPFEVQTSTGTFHSPERGDNQSTRSSHGEVVAGLAGAAGMTGLSASRLHNTRDIDTSINPESTATPSPQTGYPTGPINMPVPCSSKSSTGSESHKPRYTVANPSAQAGDTSESGAFQQQKYHHEEPAFANANFDASPSSQNMRGGAYPGASSTSTSTPRQPSGSRSNPHSAATSPYIPQDQRLGQSAQHMHANVTPKTSASRDVDSPTEIQVPQQANSNAVDQAALKRLEHDFADVKQTMQQQARDASQRILQLENERDDALHRLRSAKASEDTSRDIASGSSPDGEEYRQKHATAQRDLLAAQEQHQNLLHEHSKLQAKHADLSESSDYLTNTMDQHVRAIDTVNKALEQTRVTAQTAQQEAEDLRKENQELKQELSKLQLQIDEGTHHKQRALDLENQLSTLRDAHETSSVALNQHLTQLVGHWDQYHQNYQGSKSTSRELPDDAQHYTTLYEQQKTAHERTQKDLDAALTEIAQLKQVVNSQPKLDDIHAQHKQELQQLSESHSSELQKLSGDHESAVRDLHVQFNGKSSNLEKQYADLERDYNDSLEHFKNQRVALERTREELNRAKEANNRLEEDLQDAKLQIQDPDASTASTTSNRHAEVMVRGLKAKVIILEEERDELRQKVSQLKEAALTSGF